MLAFLGVVTTLMGLAFGAQSFLDEYDKGMDDATREIDEQTRRKEAALEELDLDFTIAKDEAIKKADYQDKASTIEEAAVTNDINNSWKQLQLQQANEANKWNNDLMNMSSQEGNALAAVAGSGARTSSINQAVDMQAATNAQNLQLEQDLTRTGDNIAMGNMLAGVAKTVNQLQYTRQQTNDLRNAYNEGGNYWNKYQLQRKNTEAGYDYNITGLQNEMEYAKKHKMEGLFTSMLSGGQAGYKLGTQIKQYGQDWGFTQGENLNAGVFKNLG